MVAGKRLVLLFTGLTLCLGLVSWLYSFAIQWRRQELRSQLIEALNRNDARPIRGLLSQGVGANTRGGPGWGGTVLIVAAKSRDIATVKYALSQGADVNQTDHGVTPLMVAAYVGSTEMARLFLDHGADPSPDDGTGWTALISYAEHWRHPQVAALLRQRAVPGQRLRGRETRAVR